MSALFSDRERIAIAMAKRWDDRYGNLDRPPWPSNFGDLQDEMMLVSAVISLAEKVEANKYDKPLKPVKKGRK